MTRPVGPAAGAKKVGPAPARGSSSAPHRWKSLRIGAIFALPDAQHPTRAPFAATALSHDLFPTSTTSVVLHQCGSDCQCQCCTCPCRFLVTSARMHMAGASKDPVTGPWIWRLMCSRPWILWNRIRCLHAVLPPRCPASLTSTSYVMCAIATPLSTMPARVKRTMPAACAPSHSVRCCGFPELHQYWCSSGSFFSTIRTHPNPILHDY